MADVDVSQARFEAVLRRDVLPSRIPIGKSGISRNPLRIQRIWETEREKVDDAAERITEFLRDVAQPSVADAAPTAEVLHRCFNELKASFDTSNGGFGGAPKFPRPVVFDFLLRYFARTGSRIPLDMTTQTLRAMASGGIYDHIGGGFHRYSVDGAWRVPHFEKMLYDQAQLVCAYIEAALITGEAVFKNVASDILDYVSRDLQAPGGGFYSAEDADSPRPENPRELGEGAFYVWSRSEIIETLGRQDGELASRYFGIEDSGNVSVDPQREFSGKNILYITQSAEGLADASGLGKADVVSILAKSRDILYARRQLRPRPRLDDKILASWNGLMISAFARAFQAFGNPSYLKTADRAAKFIITHLFDADTKSLRRRFRGGDSKVAGTMDDYAFLTRAFLDLYESSFDSNYLERALELTTRQIELFWDELHGGFFDTADGDPSLLVRLKDHYDGAEPAGNSISCMNLFRLGELLDDDRFRTKGRQILSVAALILNAQPTAMPEMAAALDFSLGKPAQIFVTGRRDDPATAMLVQVIRQKFFPNRVIMLVEPGANQERLAAMLPFVRSLTMKDGKATAYVCSDYSCRLPVTDPDAIRTLLEEIALPEGQER